MITTETSMCSCSGSTRERKTHWLWSTDILANDDGTYSIPGVVGYNADRAVVMDTSQLLLCNGETGKWSEFKK